MILRRLSLVLALFLAGPPLGAQDIAPLTVDDELARVIPSEPAISPDGTSVVFVSSALDWDENERVRRLVRVELDSGESFAFTRGPADSAPAWSPDGAHIAFLRKTERSAETPGGKKEKKDQLWVIPSGGGEAFQLTDHAEGVMRFVWHPAGASVVFTAKDPRSEEERKRLADGDDAFFVFEGPNGQGVEQWSNVWQAALEDRSMRQVTHERMVVSELDVSRDGEHVAFVFRRENARNAGNLAEIGLARLDNGKMTRLTENEAPESRVRFAQDGQSLGYLAPSAASWELREDKLFVIDLETREPRVVSESFEGDIRDFRFAGENLVIHAGVRTKSGLLSLSSVSGEWTHGLDADGVASDVSFSEDGSRSAFVWSTATDPPEIAITGTATAEAVRVLTDLNPDTRERSLASVEVVRWKSRDGLEIEGLLYLPPGYREATPVPFVLEIHGGPAGVFTQSWRGDRHVLAGLGYAILAPNVRGSRAYGDDLLRGNIGDIGGGDYEDLMSGVDAMIGRGVADSTRMGVRGWSYGGILGGWVVTHTDRFKAASLGAMVSDWRSEYGQGFNYDVRLWYIGGDPWTNPKGYIDRSPLTHVQNVTTPTLLLHGEEDTTDTVEQSMNFFNALWEKGVPTRFIRFPREGHGLREPRHQRTRLVEEITWMQKYVRGIEWSDPRSRPTKTTDDATR